VSQPNEIRAKVVHRAIAKRSPCGSVLVFQRAMFVLPTLEGSMKLAHILHAAARDRRSEVG
jgi:hypothetical protein